MSTMTLAMPRQQVHSASDTQLFNLVSLAAPPFPMEIDAARADAAPHSLPIRNAGRSVRVGGWVQEREYQRMGEAA